MTTKRTRSLTVIQALDSGVFAVSRDTPTGHSALGKLNFDQVVAILERYFAFKDDIDFTQYDKIWEEIEAQIAEGKKSGTVRDSREWK
ncbi:hypothetical protein LCGC14_1889320 [marine sediment metagenome]|uniref:Uncharacterized protein n=1 Tax=marine sediment metagenome TaxID=412755 RepID=A0A0F9GN39_9ZZZZ